MRIKTLFLLQCWGGFLLLCLATAVPAATPEVRGTWLSTTGPDHIQSGLNTESVMTDIRTIGLNTVYVETWKNGYTNYPSQTLASVTGGIDRNVPRIGSTRDLMEETLIHAHRNQMNYIGWFEYGFASEFIGSGGTPANPLSAYMLNQGWLLQDQNGNYGNSSNSFAWMNPAVPQVRQFLIDITLEAINRYDLDGIQFDDRLAWPKEFGWDATTAALYQADTGNSLPNNVNNNAFRNWRQEQVSEFAAELYQAVKAARPDLHVSVSPSITGFSETEYNADWTSWVDDGIFDEFVPQAYRETIASFNSIIDAQIDPFEPNDLNKVSVGIRLNGSSPNTPYADVEDMIDRTRLEGAAGHSLWYSEGVRDDYATELTAFYDVAGQGHAENPNFASGHRPAPVVAIDGGSDDWSVTVSNEHRYRIVAKMGSYWQEYNVVYLMPGSYVLEVPGATEVELLVDRRDDTRFLGDFDGDLDVDGQDFLAWQNGFGIANGASAADGDANADGRVDAEDLRHWQINYGWSEVPTFHVSIAIPEPQGLFLIGSFFILCGNRGFPMRSTFRKLY